MNQPVKQVFVRIFTKGGQIIDMPLPPHLKLGQLMRMVMTDHYLQTDEVHVPYSEIALALTFDATAGQQVDNVRPFTLVPKEPDPDKPL